MPIFPLRDLDGRASECNDCPLVADRRTFLGDVARFVGVAAFVTATTSQMAEAFPIRVTTGHRSGDSVRYPILPQDGAQIDHDNQIILVRWQKAIYAFELSCPHQNTALRWDGGDNRFQCPKHRSKYQPDGTFIEGRATRNMDRHAIKRDGEQVVVDLNTFYKSSEDQAGWSAAFVQLQ